MAPQGQRDDERILLLPNALAALPPEHPLGKSVSASRGQDPRGQLIWDNPK